MRFSTFLVTGVEVLLLGSQHAESNAWPLEHWRANKGRWRLFTMAIDEYVRKALRSKHYGGNVEGFVIALEIADFKRWPKSTFTSGDTAHSYKPKHRDLWCFARLDWPKVQYLTLGQQYDAYCSVVVSAARRVSMAKRKPKGFMADAFAADLAEVLANGKVSRFTKAAYDKAA
jgi:hypothetical protein